MTTRSFPATLPRSGQALTKVSREWVDRLVSSDPGLNRLRGASQSVLTIALGLGAEALFVAATHALQARPGPAGLSAAEAAGNHEFLVIAMLLGALVGMLSSFGVTDPTAKGQLVTMLFLPLPMVGAMALGISLGPHRVAALASLAVVLAVGTYCRRFGPLGFISGLLLFMGDFLGYFLSGAVSISDLGWLAAEVGVGLAVAMAVRFGLFFPQQSKALARTQRSYAGIARKVAGLALDVFEDPAHYEHRCRRLSRQLVRLNEAALMIDAQLSDPSGPETLSTGGAAHERLFDIELALTNIARFAVVLARHDLVPAQRSSIRLALADLREGDLPGSAQHGRELLGALAGRHGVAPSGATGTGETAGVGGLVGAEHTDVVLVHRFAESVIDLAESTRMWLALGTVPTAGTAAPEDSSEVVFHPAVVLNGGWLPGSSDVSATASQEKGHHLRDRVALAPYTRTAIQMGVAVGAAIAIGDVVSGRRFYWAAIGAFITFLGTNNAGEQVRKALFRVLGTIIGIAAGSGIVELVGHRAGWSITVILVSLFVGFYLQRVNYAFMVVAITVMVSQLYVDLGEFSNQLLVLRLEETALGAGIAIVTVLFVFPLRTRRVLNVALRTHFASVSVLVGHATGGLLGAAPAAVTALRDDARRLDASYQALISTAEPLRRNLFGDLDQSTAQMVHLAGAVRNYGRNLVADLEKTAPLDADSCRELAWAAETLGSSLDAVTGAFDSHEPATYTRSSALFDRTERRLEANVGSVNRGQLAIRDLKLIDGTMASMAEVLGLDVADYDTMDEPPTPRHLFEGSGP
ncbi:MAG: FUSC family protein [Acidimicrobiales bacterium]